jgi:hypothetical protein
MTAPVSPPGAGPKKRIAAPELSMPAAVRFVHISTNANAEARAILRRWQAWGHSVLKPRFYRLWTTTREIRENSLIAVDCGILDRAGPTDYEVRTSSAVL